MSEANFLEVHDPGAAAVWKSFTKGVGDKKGKARCKECKKELSCGGGSTKGLLDHLVRVHKKQPQNSASTSEAQCSKKAVGSDSRNPGLKQKTIDASITTLQCRYARMSARDGISFNVLAHSEDIRAGLVSMGYKPLRSDSAVQAAVMSYYQTAKAKCEMDLRKKIQKGHLVSLSFDEWTSVAMRRYIGILVHSGKPFESNRLFWNLGLQRIKESMPAPRCIDLVSSHLKRFNIDLCRDVISMTTDGASVMLRMGRLLDDDIPVQQICLAHGAHLAVVDTFYKADSSQRREWDASETDEDSDDDSSSQDEGDADPSARVRFRSVSGPSLGPTVARVRKLVKKFRKSPLMTDCLEKHLLQDMPNQVPPLKLMLDVRNRWNSLPPMLKRFLTLEKSIRKALVDWAGSELWMVFSSTELQSLRVLVDLLEPLEMSVKALCRQDASLLQADATIKFLLKSLLNQEAEENALRSAFLSNLAARFHQRRTPYATVAQYLANPAYDYELEKLLATLSGEAFAPMAPAKLRSMILRLATKVNAVVAVASVDDQTIIEDESEVDDPGTVILIESAVDNPAVASSSSSVAGENPRAHSLQAELEKELEAAKKLGDASATGATLQPKALISVVKQEMAIYENSGRRGPVLNKVFDALMSVKPTSVDVERVFSSCTNICSSNRSRLRDDTFDALSFLRSFFQQQK
jgi:hypothetical protein